MKTKIIVSELGKERTCKGLKYLDDDSVKLIDVDNDMELLYNLYNGKHSIGFSLITIEIDLETFEVTYGNQD